MAQTLEKLFLQKLRELPKDEVEMKPPVKGVKKPGKKTIPSAPQGSGTLTRKKTQELQVNKLLLGKRMLTNCYLVNKC